MKIPNKKNILLLAFLIPLFLFSLLLITPREIFAQTPTSYSADVITSCSNECRRLYIVPKLNPYYQCVDDCKARLTPSSTKNPTPQLVGASTNITDYAPLEPLPGVKANAGNFGEFLSSLLKLIIASGAIFAVLIITVSGVFYMTTEATGSKSKAKERIWAAIWGLLLLIAAVLILQTTNPDVLNFDFSSLNSKQGTVNRP